MTAVPKAPGPRVERAGDDTRRGDALIAQGQTPGPLGQEAATQHSGTCGPSAPKFWERKSRTLPAPQRTRGEAVPAAGGTQATPRSAGCVLVFFLKHC